MPLSRWSSLCCRRCHSGALEPADSEGSESESPVASSEPAGEPSTDPRAELVVTRDDYRLVGRTGFTPEEGSVSSDRDVRWYAIWYIPDRHYTEVAGVHWGCGTTAYSAILELNKGNFGGIRWKRFDSLAEAQKGFRGECARYGLSPHLAEKIVGWVLEKDPAI